MGSRDNFENNQIQMQDLQIKRQYIEELRKKLNILIEENRYLKNDITNQGHPQLQMDQDEDQE